MLLGHVGHLVGAHAVVRENHEQRAGDEGEREHASELHARELRHHDGEDGEHHAPCARAKRVANIVARRAVRSVLSRLVGELAFRHRAQKAIAPPVDGACKEKFIRVECHGIARAVPSCRVSSKDYRVALPTGCQFAQKVKKPSPEGLGFACFTWNATKRAHMTLRRLARIPQPRGRRPPSAMRGDRSPQAARITAKN